MFLDKLKEIASFLHITKSDWSSNLVCLEFNPTQVKVLKLNHSLLNPTVDCFSILPLEDRIIVREEIKNKTLLANKLREHFIEKGIDKTNVAFAMPRSSAMIKTILVDSRLTAEEIDSRVWIEANKLFPNLISDIYLDYLVTGTVASDIPQSEVTLVACRKDQIKPYLDVIEEAGLQARMIDINSYALARAVQFIAKQEKYTNAVALINISYSLITLVVINNAGLCYTHELNYDGSQLNTKTALQESEAEGAARAIEALKTYLSLHIRHIMQFFYSSRPHLRIEKILLSGDCAADIKELTAFVVNETGKEVEIANPFKKMNIAQGIDQGELFKMAPALVLCCGLAQSEFD